jgi:hypothetical protein
MVTRTSCSSGSTRSATCIALCFTGTLVMPQCRTCADLAGRAPPQTIPRSSFNSIALWFEDDEGHGRLIAESDDLVRRAKPAEQGALAAY